MTVVGEDEKSSRMSAFLSVVALPLLVLTGCTSGAPTLMSQREETPAKSQNTVSQGAEFIKVARTEHGHFFQRGTNLFYSSGVCVVFQYMDQPPGARWIDGEDANFGIVDIYDIR